MKRNILLIGSGGREHTLAWKITQSDQCGELFVCPGNAGTSSIATNIDLDINNIDGLVTFCNKNNIKLIVVGPEQPLVDGIQNKINEHPNGTDILIVGPDQHGAQLEGSKAFAKKFMQKYNIPTADYKEFNQESRQEGINFIEKQNLPIVLKADGLAAGKGVLILEDREEAKKEFNNLLDGKFGAASQKVVIESFLKGIEFSVFVLTDGINYKILPIAKDYKRIGKGDTGLNTGGMGSISPVSFVTEALMNQVEKEIIKPTIKGIVTEKMNYKGFIFIGLILTEEGPQVIEYNCRMGDPETQSVVPRIQNDIIDLFVSLGDGSLIGHEIEIDARTAATVVLVSGGYPEAYTKGKKITNTENIKDSLVFHAGTVLRNNELLTNGGRVLAVTTLSESQSDALALSFKNARQIVFEGRYFRDDIGFDL